MSSTSMFRDRTNLFLSFRRTIPRNNASNTSSRFDSLVEEEEGLIGHRKPNNNNFKHKKGGYKDEANEQSDSIEMKTLAPSIFDISHELDDHLKLIKLKTNELGALYKKLLITTYNEKSRLETKLEDLNYEITKKFELCYVLIKKFEFLQKNHQRLKLNYNNNEISIIENFKKNYALKIQEHSLVFRNLQNNYIKFLRDEEDEEDSLLPASSKFNSSSSSTPPPPSYDLIQEEADSKNIENYSKQVLQQTQLQIKQNPNSQILATREREISKIAMGILEISTIFKEMESLIIDQGSVLDRIDYNISNTVQDLKDSDKELIKAKGYQKRTTKCKIIFLLSLIVFALVILVVVKPHGTTKYIEKPSSDKPSSDKQPETNVPDTSVPDTKIPERPTIEKPPDSLVKFI